MIITMINTRFEMTEMWKAIFLFVYSLKNYTKVTPYPTVRLMNRVFFCSSLNLMKRTSRKQVVAASVTEVTSSVRWLFIIDLK